MKRIRIVLADDHPIVIEGLRRLLDRPELKIVGTAADGEALVKTDAKRKPDVIVSDFTMPLLNGIDAIRQLRKRKSKAKVILLTMHAEPIFATEALDAGASGYLLKSAAGDELIEAIHAVNGGSKYISKSIAAEVDQVRKIESAKPREKRDTTNRQREVLQLLAEGLQVKEIAATLGISPKTVEYHKYRVMETLGIRTIAELARYAEKRGVVK